MRIFGAGMAGLLAANLLRRHRPAIYEKQSRLPSNHEALLRFRSDAISRLTGIPFQKVVVHKAIWSGGRLHNEVNLQLANMYAQKVNDRINSRSILKLDSAERWIAPANFVDQLAVSCNIEYSTNIDEARATEDDPIVSTLPMPMLMDIMDWPIRPGFGSKKIWVMTAILMEQCDVYQTIYFPGSDEIAYRASITRNKLIVEFIADPTEFAIGHKHDVLLAITEHILSMFGIRSEVDCCLLSEQRFGKISPIDNDARKQFIMAMTTEHNIYSLGRYATWRNLLLDDLVHDIQQINEFVSTKDHYQRTLSATHKPNWEQK
jgi:hypothetical protein